MKNRTFFTFILICIFGGLCAGLPAQSEALPPWVMFEQARQAFYAQEYGQALDLLKQVLLVRSPYPEAEQLIGEIFMLEGEYEIARKQFSKVYEQREFLETPAEKYTALYKLKDIYLQREEYKNYEDTLLKIISEDPVYFRDRWLLLQNKFLKVFTEEGIDRFMLLYRLEDPAAAGAHGELGWFYYKSGRYEISIIHSLFTLNIVLSEAIRVYRIQDPEYTFTTLTGLLELVLERVEGIPMARIEAVSIRESPLKIWLLGDAQLFRKLYYLAGALYAAGKKQLAEELWGLCAASIYSGQYGTLARKQLKNPWIEDYLDIGSERIEQYQKTRSSPGSPSE